MGSSDAMKEPVYLLELSPSGSLNLNPKAIELLSAITQPVLVVAILGPPNTGKSYLMSRLANRSKGFPLGTGKRPPGWRTWIWCLPYPNCKEERLVILDIDGLEGEGNEETQTKTFALALILSSILIYNSEGTVDQTALDKLSYITKLPRYIQGCAADSQGAICPEFLWCVRDSELELWMGDFRLVADDYLNDVLATGQGSHGDCSVSHFLKQCFHERRCFEFSHPCPEAKGQSLDEVLEGQLDRDFQMQTERLREHILDAQAKSLAGGRPVNGQTLARMIEACVSCLCQGRTIVLDELYDAALCLVPRVEETARKRPCKTKTERIVPLAKPREDGAQWNMESPVCLIENSESGELCINQKAVDDILSKIKQPVVVVAVAGLYRTGKSYLMNKLADTQKGFSLGSTIQSHTKGIWMMCVPHPLKHDHCLILLDTEGLGDVEKGDTNNDSWIFALSVLLSSMLVYNSMGTIDQYAVDKLHYVTELTDLIKVKSVEGDEESIEFIRFFPAFVWSVRDFTLELKLNGVGVTEDEYLENALKLKHGTSKNIQKYNLPRECIRNYFPSRKCFVFDRPADKQTIRNLEQVADSQLDPEFVKQTQKFVQHVYSKAQTKTLKGGQPVTGRMLGALAVTYVDAIRSGQIPCLESAVHTLADIENTAAVQEAAQAYQEWMGKRVTLPTETVEELSKIHNQVHPEALKLFMRRCFSDQGHRYQEQFMKEVAKMYAAICKENREMSVDISSRTISDLGAAVQEKIKQGCYTKAGGYSEYEKDMAELVKQYRAKPRKGVQAEQVLEDFLRNMQQFSASLRQVDQTMTEREKEVAAARVRAEVAEQERKVKEEERRATEQRLLDERRAMEANIAQLKEKAKEEQAQLLKEHEKVLNQRLQEQEKLVKEGFQGRADELQQEINSLKKEKEEAASPSFVDLALDIAILAAPGFYKAIPIAGKVGKYLWKKF